jgi:signal transduction histidine kinase
VTNRQAEGLIDRVNSCGGCLLRLALAGGFGLLWLLDLALTRANATVPHLAILVAGLFVATAALLPRPVERWAVVAVTVSITATLLISAAPTPNWKGWGLAETAALLILIVRVLRHTPPPWVIALTTTLSFALVALPLRQSTREGILWSAPLAVCGAAAIGFGVYLRSVDAARSRSLFDARRSERLELARDLHDFVAHHVTGIVVQAQAARYAAHAVGPDEFDTMLAGIEKAGTEALSSMRRLVGVLRETDDAATRPTGDLAQIEELVTDFSRTGPPTTLSVAQEVMAVRLPPEVATSLHRVVQESLTNVRKHAADATTVRVAVYLVGASIEVSVRDDGRGSAARWLSSAGRGGGFGLAGLTERVTAIGGSLAAGPRPEGGFEVVARLPLAQSHG